MAFCPGTLTYIHTKESLTKITPQKFLFLTINMIRKTFVSHVCDNSLFFWLFSKKIGNNDVECLISRAQLLWETIPWQKAWIPTVMVTFPSSGIWTSKMLCVVDCSQIHTYPPLCGNDIVCIYLEALAENKVLSKSTYFEPLAFLHYSA